MEELEYEIRKENAVIGRARAERQGLYWRVTAEAELETDRIVRLYAHGEGKSMNLGVLLPEGETLRLCRRIPVSAFSFAPDTCITTSPDAVRGAPPEPRSAAGAKSAEADGAKSAEADGGEAWEPFSGTVLGYPAEGMQRKCGDGTELSIAYEAGKEFSLMPLFRFCALRQVRGRLCWVLLLDADGKPTCTSEKKPLTSAENVLE